MLREAYHLPLRSTRGLVHSVMRLLGVKLPVPDYSTPSRRARLLRLSLAAHRAQTISHPGIDSSGLKVYGEGEWEVRAHGADKRRTWRKLHVSMDASTHQLAAALLTDKDLLERNAPPHLLEQTEGEVGRACADGAYDFEQCYRAIKQHGAGALLPPRRDAAIRGKSPFGQWGENLRAIRRRGRKAWEKTSGYHRRSLVERAFSRLETLFSDRSRSRRADTRAVEATTRCAAMDRVTSLGMPRSYAA
jgi:hypothetical protein